MCDDPLTGDANQGAHGRRVEPKAQVLFYCYIPGVKWFNFNYLQLHFRRCHGRHGMQDAIGYCIFVPEKHTRKLDITSNNKLTIYSRLRVQSVQMSSSVIYAMLHIYVVCLNK